MSRFLITLTITVSLLVAQRIYTAILLPMTAIAAVSTGPEVQAAEASIREPALFEQQAMDVFPDAPWTRHAEHTFQLADSVTLYFREFQRVPGSGNTIQISPVAILWRDSNRPDAPPYRILAERAQIKFQNSFFDTAISLTDAQPGRVVWASLEGSVHIDGPDGLKIEGQNFKFEEESRQLYSDYPIQFAFGPTVHDQRRIVGTSNQIQVTFLPSTNPALGKDMPRIGGLAQVLLRRNVTLDSTFEQQGEPRQFHLTSHGSLLYDVVKGECTIDDRVHITHKTIRQELTLQDNIECEWLKLQFSPKKEKGTAPTTSLDDSPQAAFDQLELKSIQAKGEMLGQGKRLKITSDEQQIVAVMQDLFYDAVERRALLSDQEHVAIRRVNTTFRSPIIDFRHTAQNTLESLECRGPGEMEVAQEGMGQNPLISRWAGQVQVHADPTANCHVIRIEKQVELGVPEQFLMNSDTFTLWVDMDRATHQPANNAAGNALSRPLPLKRVKAEGAVTFNSNLLQVRRANLIDAIISPGIIEAIHAPQKSPEPQGGSEEATAQKQSSPWIVEADRLNLDLVHDSVAATIDFRQIVGEGSVTVQHYPGQSFSSSSRQMEGPLFLTGHKIVAENAGGIRQTMTLLSNPNAQEKEQSHAVAGFGPARIWGGQIMLSRHDNRVHIPGPGGLRTPIPSQTGRTQPGSPENLDIIWSEGMNFDGLAMRFWGKITASMPGEQENISRLLCEDLTAILNQRISFVDPQSRTVEPAIESLLGKHNVVLEAFEFRDRNISAVRTATLASFELHQSTGEFKGQGPGQIHSWTLGDQIRFAPGEKPQANQPAKPAQSKWRYSGITYSGNITGNWNKNEATLRDRVEVITAPVEKARIKFQRNQLSTKTAEAENAVWMKCHQLRIVQRQSGEQRTGSLEVFATGATELEGHVFHAYADELTYDERSGQFILRGLGREATLYHQPQIGQPSATSAAQMIKFIPAKREIAIGGSTGLSGSY